MTDVQEAHREMERISDAHAELTYRQIAELVGEFARLSKAELSEAASMFGVCPLKNTKAGILAAVRAKIEFRKTTAVRCGF